MANDEYREPQQAECPGCGQDGTGLESHLPNCNRHPVNRAGLVEKPDDGRAEFAANRAAGLRVRNETRQERAIRRQVAEEIAAAIQAYPGPEWNMHQTWWNGYHDAKQDCQRIAREIGAKEAS